MVEKIYKINDYDYIKYNKGFGNNSNSSSNKNNKRKKDNKKDNYSIDLIRGTMLDTMV